ncbi:Hypothetical_protein [Hexamita inflata]|uniref:Hypothetical_protein n=1 Tax=Hexamita inflata TaxID=28002 RepID=A0ABP1HU39_9EUKA
MESCRIYHPAQLELRRIAGLSDLNMSKQSRHKFLPIFEILWWYIFGQLINYIQQANYFYFGARSTSRACVAPMELGGGLYLERDFFKQHWLNNMAQLDV